MESDVKNCVESVTEQETRSLMSALELQIKESQHKYALLAADLENMRKRAAREYETVRFDSAARILKPLLSVLDDIERAIAVEQGIHQDGLLLIQKGLLKLLEQNQVVEMNCEGLFDPEYHEAVMHVADTGKESGAIVSVLQKGYMLNGRVLRSARVSIAQ